MIENPVSEPLFKPAWALLQPKLLAGACGQYEMIRGVRLELQPRPRPVGQNDCR